MRLMAAAGNEKDYEHFDPPLLMAGDQNAAADSQSDVIALEGATRWGKWRLSSGVGTRGFWGGIG